MALLPPNKDWMSAPLNSDEYLDGLESFLKFMTDRLGKGTWCSCPCARCRNVSGRVDPKIVADHLIRIGIDPSYTTWYFHGESFEEDAINVETIGPSSHSQYEDGYSRDIDLVSEELGYVHLDGLDESMDGSTSDEDRNIDEMSLDDDSNSHNEYH
ncbi:hypothetical protein IFM89_040011 [Coptis chinensis]|uniref:Transposase-associated domain-containing protein n=1 Tax=Coptis chinensis TaxID=261450 RepID=A0A835GUQ5_9MAGN|nr:hypothetical protein IFM89_040011 [Coptis chinensis]